MKKSKHFLFMTVVILLMSLSMINISNTSAIFELGSVEDQSDWIVASTQYNFKEDFMATFAFSYEDTNTDVSITPYLSLKTNFNLPFNFTGYLSRKIKKEQGLFGINVDSLGGNITLGINGTIVVYSPITNAFLVNLVEGENSMVANFASLIGENTSIPINFSPLKISFSNSSGTGYDEITLVLTLVSHLKGNVSISAIVDEQELVWNTGEEIYFENISVLKNESDFTSEITDIQLNFQNVSLVIDSLNTTLLINTPLGIISQRFLIDFSNISFTEGEKTAGEYLAFLLNSLFNVENQTIIISIEKADFPSILTLVLIVSFLGFVRLRRKRH
ncbi:MAG: hypothetical protein ACTSSG_08055 [Candidatus Heimdallarchaeaceae archaeon]